MPKNKGGRPRLPESEKKTFKIVGRLSKEEHTLFEKNFKLSGFAKQADYIKERTLNSQSRVSPAEMQQLLELRLLLDQNLEQAKKIGTNFNQLVHLANAEKRLPDTMALQSITKEFEKITSANEKLLQLDKNLQSLWLSKSARERE